MDSNASLKILEILKIWKADNNRIVGIEGYSGIGKTTIGKELSKNNEIEVVHMDDFVSTANTKEELLPQLENNKRELILQWKPENGLEKLREKILDFKKKSSAKILVIEGVFLSHSDVVSDLLDKRIYLDGDKKKADERRIVREKARWEKDYFPETHPDSFARLFTLAYARYEELYQPKETADLVVEFNV